MPQSVSLYRHFDADNRLLYVGISLGPLYRQAQHRRTANWWRDIARIEIEHFASQKEALKAERRAIHEEHPVHNRAHVWREPRPGFNRHEVSEIVGVSKAQLGVMLRRRSIPAPQRLGHNRYHWPAQEFIDWLDRVRDLSVDSSDKSD